MAKTWQYVQNILTSYKESVLNCHQQTWFPADLIPYYCNLQRKSCTLALSTFKDNGCVWDLWGSHKTSPFYSHTMADELYTNSRSMNLLKLRECNVHCWIMKAKLACITDTAWLVPKFPSCQPHRESLITSPCRLRCFVAQDFKLLFFNRKSWTNLNAAGNFSTQYIHTHINYPSGWSSG